MVIRHDNNPVITQTTTNLFDSAVITWDNVNNVPPSIRALTPTSFADAMQFGFLKSGGSRMEVSYILNGLVAGGARLNQTGTNQLTIKGREVGGKTPTYSKTTNFVPGPVFVGSFTPWGNTTPIKVSPQIGLPVTAIFSNGYEPNATNDYPDSYNVIFTITIRFTAVIYCSGSSLQTPICLDLCTGSADARTRCANEYISYCTQDNLKNLTAPPPPGEARNICESFIQDYIATANGATKPIDGPLEQYCSKYKSLKDLNNVSQQERDLCGCHLAPEAYEEFARELGLQYPNLAALYANATKCAIPICVNSPYLSPEVAPGKCKAPLCFQSITINNDGQISGDISNDQECNVGGGGGTNLLPLVIGLFLILLVLLIFVWYYSK